MLDIHIVSPRTFMLWCQALFVVYRVCSCIILDVRTCSTTLLLSQLWQHLYKQVVFKSIIGHFITQTKKGLIEKMNPITLTNNLQLLKLSWIMFVIFHLHHCLHLPSVALLLTLSILQSFHLNNIFCFCLLSHVPLGPIVFDETLCSLLDQTTSTIKYVSWSMNATKLLQYK
jgi:hypothetical protein